MKRFGPGKNAALAAALLVCLCAGSRVLGCVPRSLHPLTERRAEEREPALMGVWFHAGDNESLHLHLGFGKEPGSLRAALVETQRDGVLKVSAWQGHLSRLNGTLFLNLLEDPPDPGTPGYLFVKVRLETDRLCIALASDTPFEQAILAKRLQGSVKKGRFSTDVLVTEGQQGLQRFVLENLQDLFPEETCLARLRPPEARTPDTPGK